MSAVLSREKILVVDDEPQVLVALEDLLSDDFLVFKSESAERALHLVEDQPDIAVVISDQRMPKMHGDELLTRLRARIGAERILATGYADLTAVVRAVNEGQIFAYVTKPWDPEDLRMKIQRAADHFRLARDLEQERRLLEDLMRSMPDAIYFKDSELRFQRVNSALLSLFELSSADQIVGKRLSDLWPENEAVARAELAERELLKQRGISRDSVSNFVIAGERRFLATTKAAISDRAGKAVGLVGIGRDVTTELRTQESLRSREEQLRLTFLASSAGLFDWNLLTGRLEHSPSLATMILGDERAYLRREEFEALVHPDDIEQVRDAVGRHLSERVPLRGLELRAKVGDEYRWVEVNAQAVWDDAGTPLRLVGSSSDISERKQQEARIRRLTRTYALLSGVNATILRVHQRRALLAEVCNIAVHVGELALAVVASADADESAAPLASNGASSDLHPTIARWLVHESTETGSLVERAALTRRPVVINDLRPEDWGDQLAQSLLAAGHLALAVIPVVVSGRVDCLLALVADQLAFFDEDQLKLLAELADNTGFALEHSAQAERLEFLAFNDELTGLANRRLLTDRLTQQLAVCTESKLKLAVVIIDVERFRQINETLGRRAGDELLIEIARRLSAISDGKCPIARYSSNTFAAVVGPLETEAEVAQWLELALTSLGLPVQVAGTELRLAARAGISTFPSDGADADVLLANAEAALKKAKDSAHRYLFYTSAMNGRVAERLSLETRLRKAIEKQEFLLHYQPKVELKTGRVVGLEALIRWLGPDGKLIPPGLFIPLLEETGMIVEVGTWVMRQAAWQYADWTKRGFDPPRVAVNVSPLQLGQPNFVACVDSVLKEYPLANSGLDLEITESVLMEDLAGNTEKLRVAKAAGLGVAIDDFGTGYSSLGYISRLPIDALKIDRSFVANMTDDAQQVSIVTTIISLAHALDLKVIAEGVETTAQAHLLRLLTCDQIQGYLVARPQAASDAERLLGNRFELSGKLT